jgi:hypothetical protein
MARGYSLGIYVFLCWAALPHSAPAQDVDAAKINEAIDKGIAFLTKVSAEQGVKNMALGPCALRGWTLLEGGLSAKDEVMKALADRVRVGVPETHATYDVALSLIFLDKLADPGDVPLIESLAVRLLRCQTLKGGWGYFTGLPNEKEQKRLNGLIEDFRLRREKGEAIKLPLRTPKDVLKDLENQLNSIEGGPDPKYGAGDNSNTQFAMMAVWVARRRGVPVDECLARVEKRFRDSQVDTGAWGYEYPAKVPAEDDNTRPYPAMTCAGLLGIALGQGVQAQPKDLSKDPQIKKGFEVLDKALSTKSDTSDNFFYFLFSMERAGVIYNVKQIGAHDWYKWGARMLLACQTESGAWPPNFGSDYADTCFALLFLKRANVAKDLTEILEAPIRKGPGAKKPDPKKLPDNLFDPPKLSPKEAPKKKDAPKEKAAGATRTLWQAGDVTPPSPGPAQTSRAVAGTLTQGLRSAVRRDVRRGVSTCSRILA